MDSENASSGSERRDNWYVIKGIPVAVLIALAVHGGTFAWFLSGLNSRVEVQGVKLTEAIAEWKTEMGKVNTKMDALSTAFQSGSVPAALNERRIADAERLISRLEARVAENERRLAAETLRGRARSER
jgi:uncharacterized coiled-coil protein SlyX